MEQLLRKETPDKFGFKELQNVILNIASDFDEFCQRHDIQYCLMGGSALGAKRHQGFIPWDDDLDVYMTSKEYEKFRGEFIKHGDKGKYYLQELGASKGMITTAKIRLNNSYYEETVVKDWKIHQGVYMDIFVLHICPNNILSRYWQYFWSRYLCLKSVANKPLYNRKKGIVGFAIKLIRLFPKRFLLTYALKQMYRFKGLKTGFICNYLGRESLHKATYKKEVFDGVKRVPFETIELNVNNNLEQFLEITFGDYMTPPPMETIKYEQHSSTWNLDKCSYDDKSEEKFLL